jgi:hypothetical protein
MFRSLRLAVTRKPFQLTIAAAVLVVASLPVDSNARSKAEAGPGKDCALDGEGGALANGEWASDDNPVYCTRIRYTCTNGTLCLTESRIRGCKAKKQAPLAPKTCYYVPTSITQGWVGDPGLGVDGIAPPDEPLSPKAPITIGDPSRFY